MACRQYRYPDPGSAILSSRDTTSTSSPTHKSQFNNLLLVLSITTTTTTSTSISTTNFDRGTTGSIPYLLFTGTLD